MAADVPQLVCRHLIGMGWYEGRVDSNGEFVERPDFYGASGFVLQLHDDLPGSWCLVTAGHVFTDHEKRLSKPHIGSKSHSIFDIWGPHSTCGERIPFNLFDAPAHVVYDKEQGIDVGIVVLPDLVLQLLGQTTVPFTRRNWEHQSHISFDFFAMLGLPLEDAEQVFGDKNGVEAVTTFQNPALLFLDPCPLPSNMPPASNPQFVARIDSRVRLKSIVGMSGGPIFGFRKNEGGELAYWPVAIQSRWLPDRRIVIATYLAPLAREIERDIDKLLGKGPT